MPSFVSVLAIALAASFFLVTVPAAAFPYFSEIFPNTEDDANLEYFSLRNSVCEPVSLSGYSAADASGKTYAFSGITLFSTGSGIRFPRLETKIALNNENETLSIFDPFGNIVDVFAYAASSKGIPLVRTEFPEPSCPVPEPLSEIPPSHETVSPDSEISDVQVSDTVDSGTNLPPSESEPPVSPDAPYDIPEGTGGTPEPESVEPPPDSSEPTLPVPTPPPPVTPPAPITVFPPSATPSVSRASPERLALVDANNDGRFDFAEVRYSEDLSGTADPSQFLLYSNTGGLYPFRVGTASGYFSRAEISGPILRLSFSGATLEKTRMRVDDSTSSEFRIKSSADNSLRTMSSGLPVLPLGLTTSFSGYSSDRIEFVPPFPSSATGSSEEADSEAEIPQYSVSEGISGTGSASSGSWESLLNTSPAFKTKKAISSEKLRPPPPPVDTDQIELVPSSGVDLLPSGKYRYACFSSSCPVSFGVTGVPKGGKGYWEFSDGRRRFGASTSTLGKSVPATYRLSYVFETPTEKKRIPVSLSVYSGTESSDSASTKAVTKKASKSVAAEKSSTAPKKSASSKSPLQKTSASGSPSAPVKKAPPFSENDGGNPSPFLRVVSMTVAALFLGLFGGAWFSGYFRP